MTLRYPPFLVLFLTGCAHVAAPTPLPTERGWYLLEPASEAPATATPAFSGVCGSSPQTGFTWSAATQRVLASTLTMACPTSTEVLPSPPLWLVHLGPGWMRTNALPATGWRYAVRAGDPACLLLAGPHPTLTLAVLDTLVQAPESLHLEVPDAWWQRRGSVLTDSQRRFFRMNFLQPGLGGEVERHALFDASGRRLGVLDEEPRLVLRDSDGGATWRVQQPAASGGAPRLHLIAR